MEELGGSKLKNEVRTAIECAATVLRESFTWVNTHPLTPKQKFCLLFVSSCCVKIPISESSCDWVQRHSTAISLVGHIHHKFVTSAGIHQTFEAGLPDKVTERPPKAALEYFRWIRKIHQALAAWRTSLENDSANYRIVHSYKSNHSHMYNVCRELCALLLLVPKAKVEATDLSYLQRFEELNQILLRYIPEDRSAGW